MMAITINAKKAKASAKVREGKVFAFLCGNHRDLCVKILINHKPLRTMSCNRIRPTQVRSPSTTGNTFI